MPRWPERAIAAAALLLAACVPDPLTGRPELPFQAAAREVALGAAAAQQVELHIGVVDTPDLAAYVDAVGQRLAAHAPRRDFAHHFAVADMKEPNAFALPGGWVFVSRGLLVLANSEDELAGALAHELGHLDAGPTTPALRRVLAAARLPLLDGLGREAAAAAAGHAAPRESPLSGADLIAHYSPGEEHEADAAAEQLLALSGYDPGALAALLLTLEHAALLPTDADVRPSFLDSHPRASIGVDANAWRSSQPSHAAPARIAASRSEFLARLEGLRVGPDPAQGVLRGTRFVHPGLSVAIELPPGWRFESRRDAAGAAAPRDDAFIVLEAQGGPGDPVAAARQFAAERRLALGEGMHLAIGGWDAYASWSDVRQGDGRLSLDFTWIAHPRAVLRVTGVATASRWQVYGEAFRAAARSLRALTRAESESLVELHLALVQARAGERLADLSRRSRNAWSPAATAVANALPQEATLAPGEVVKVALAVPYRP